MGEKVGDAMLNVCFSESARGSLRCSKITKICNQVVACIPDDLSVGDIRNIDDFDTRKRSILKFHGDFYDDTEDFSEYISTDCKKRYYEFFEQIDNHREILIWYSNSPHEFCGMLYVLWLLRNSPAKISAVNCSQPILKKNSSVIFHHSTGEISPEDFSDFLPYIQTIADKPKQDYSELWEKLVKENGLLRVFSGISINEAELSYPELLKKLADEKFPPSDGNTIKTAELSYYDEFILNQIPRVPIRIADAIGIIFGRLAMIQNIFIGDNLIALRIRALIEQGILKQEGHNKRFYENTIMKTQ